MFSVLHVYPRSRIAGPYGNLMLTFRGTAKLFAKAAAPFYISTSSI